MRRQEDGFAGLGLGSARAAGFLLPVEPGLPPLALARHDVTVEIANQAARTKVSQTFHNPHPRPLEAHFLFPKPPGAQITDFALYIDGRPVRAETLEKEKAAGIYEDIVRRMRDPGLLEFLDRDTFRVRIFPVPAQSDQKIALEFTPILPFDGGLAWVRYHRTNLPAHCPPDIAGRPFNHTTIGALSNLYNLAYKRPEPQRPYVARDRYRVYVFGVNDLVTKLHVGLFCTLPDMADMDPDAELPLPPDVIYDIRRMVIDSARLSLLIPERLQNDGADIKEPVRTEKQVSINDAINIVDMP